LDFNEKALLWLEKCLLEKCLVLLDCRGAMVYGITVCKV